MHFFYSWRRLGYSEQGGTVVDSDSWLRERERKYDAVEVCLFTLLVLVK